MTFDSRILGKDPDGFDRVVLVDESGFVRVGSTVTISGNIASGITDTGNPVEIGYQARTSLPTAVTSGQRVTAISDKFGRQITLPYSIRDLITTGRTILTRAQEGTILAGVASVFLDVVEVTCSNSSSISIAVDFRSATAAAVDFTLQVPATNTLTKHFTVPYPDSEVATAWTAQTSGITDQSDSPITVTMVAVRNV